MEKSLKKQNNQLCEICRVERGKKKFHTHHITYKEDGVEEITMEICQPCHNLCHGRRTIGHVLFPRKHKQKSDKGLAMINFAIKVLEAFLRRMKWVMVINPKSEKPISLYNQSFLKVIERELLKTEEINRADEILQDSDGEETTH